MKEKKYKYFKETIILISLILTIILNLVFFTLAGYSGMIASMLLVLLTIITGIIIYILLGILIYFSLKIKDTDIRFLIIFGLIFLGIIYFFIDKDISNLLRFIRDLFIFKLY